MAADLPCPDMVGLLASGSPDGNARQAPFTQTLKALVGSSAHRFVDHEPDPAVQGDRAVLKAAAHYAAHGLFQEVHGLRRGIEPACANANWLLGASLIAAGAPAAQRDLEMRAEAGDGAAALWLILGMSIRTKSALGPSGFQAAAPHLADLPVTLRDAGRLHLAFAAAQEGETQFAKRLVEQSPSPSARAIALTGAFALNSLQSLVAGMLAEHAGAFDAAKGHYDAAIASGGRPGAEAALRCANLLWQETPELLPQTIQRLEDLRWAWRGDEVEARTLLTLIRAYSLRGNDTIALDLAVTFAARFPERADRARTIIDAIVETKFVKAPETEQDTLMRFEGLARLMRRGASETSGSGSVRQALQILSETYHLPTDLVTYGAAVAPVRLALRGLKGTSTAQSPSLETQEYEPLTGHTEKPGAVVDATDLPQRDKMLLSLLNIPDAPDVPAADEERGLSAIDRALQYSRNLETLVRVHLSGRLNASTTPEGGEGP